MKMNVTDAVKLCDQLSKDIDPSSRAAAHGAVYMSRLFQCRNRSLSSYAL